MTLFGESSPKKKEGKDYIGDRRGERFDREGWKFFTLKGKEWGKTSSFVKKRFTAIPDSI